MAALASSQCAEFRVPKGNQLHHRHQPKVLGLDTSPQTDSQSPPAGPNVRLHAHLFGPLKSNSGNWHMLCMTNAFTKIAMVVHIPNKEATSVATNILNHWVYRLSAPKEMHTDGGKQFVNKQSNELWAHLGIKDTKTTMAHPQCNAQVENLNDQKIFCSVSAWQHPRFGKASSGHELGLQHLQPIYHWHNSVTIIVWI